MCKSIRQLRSGQQCMLCWFLALMFVPRPIAAAQPLFPEPRFYCGYSPRCILTGDFNRDGKLDIVTANEGGYLAVALGKGDDTFKELYFELGHGDVSLLSATKGDFNQDGKLDVVAANAAGDNIRLFLGNGDGTFQAPVDYTVGANPHAVAVADLNGDGKPDIVTADTGTDAVPGRTVSILFSKGDGTFLPAVPYTAGVAPIAVVVADVNRDGRPDILTANLGTSQVPGRTVSVLLNRGNGTFWPAVEYDVGDTPRALAVGDVNGDGRPDVITANYGANGTQGSSVSVLLNRGNGIWGHGIFRMAVPYSMATQYSVGERPQMLALRDLNSDGRPDIITGNAGYIYGPSISVLMGGTNGTFQPERRLSVNRLPSALTVEDVNSDGQADILLGFHDYDDAPLGLLLGNGDGTFQTACSSPVGASPRRLRAADLNRDGRLDLVTVNDDNTVSILLGRGDGTFRPAVKYWVGGNPVDVFVGDFDGDGILDLITDNREDYPNFTRTRSLLFGKGDGTFRPAVTTADPGPSVVGDFNGDGRLDLATVIVRGTLSVMLGNGDGTFGNPIDSAIGIDVSPVAVASLHRGGKLDLVLEQFGNPPGYAGLVCVMFGNGDGTFQLPVGAGGGHGVSGVAVGDVNGDGWPDIVCASYMGDYMSTFQNNAGSGSFSYGYSNEAPYHPTDIVVADFDGDGMLDYAVTVRGGLGVALGGGYIVNYGITAGNGPAVVGDFNGDGWPDIVTTSINTGMINVYLNAGK